MLQCKVCYRYEDQCSLVARCLPWTMCCASCSWEGKKVDETGAKEEMWNYRKKGPHHRIDMAHLSLQRSELLPIFHSSAWAILLANHTQLDFTCFPFICIIKIMLAARFAWKIPLMFQGRSHDPGFDNVIWVAVISVIKNKHLSCCHKTSELMWQNTWRDGNWFDGIFSFSEILGNLLKHSDLSELSRGEELSPKAAAMTLADLCDLCDLE